MISLVFSTFPMRFAIQIFILLSFQGGILLVILSIQLYPFNTEEFLHNNTLPSKKLRICCFGRNPHMPSNGVKAIAISGLWLSSGYLSGFVAWSSSACFCTRTKSALILAPSLKSGATYLVTKLSVSMSTCLLAHMLLVAPHKTFSIFDISKIPKPKCVSIHSF